MAKKRAIIGFSGIHLAPIKTNTDKEYTTEAGFPLPHAGSMSRTVKESSSEIYYDDVLYADVKETLGEEVEIKIGEAPIEILTKLGVGEDKSGALECDLNITPKDYSLRCKADTVSKHPFYFKWRMFTLNSVRVDNLQTKSNGAQVAEVVLKGTITQPARIDVKAWALMELADDKSNEVACNKFLADAETMAV